MLKIITCILECPGAKPIWSLIDDSTGELIGNVDPDSMMVMLESEKEDMTEKMDKKALEEREPQSENLRIPLTEKRFLDIAEFQQYTSLGKNRAADLARASGCIFRFGRRKMIDRIKFDAWCDAQ